MILFFHFSCFTLKCVTFTSKTFNHKICEKMFSTRRQSFTSYIFINKIGKKAKIKKLQITNVILWICIYQPAWTFYTMKCKFYKLKCKFCRLMCQNWKFKFKIYTLKCKNRRVEVALIHFRKYLAKIDCVIYIMVFFMNETTKFIANFATST